VAEARVTITGGLAGWDHTQHVARLLANFRLLEGAGACVLIADEDRGASKRTEWWTALGDTARSYRSAIDLTTAHGFSAIDAWSQSGASGTDWDLAAERVRLGSEHRRWLREIPGGSAYEAWLRAYVAVAELDGGRALKSLEQAAAIVRKFVGAPGLGDEPSTYDFLQSVADTLASFLPLSEHPLRDVRRFALLPPPLRTG
jgi:hypothetical protein